MKMLKEILFPSDNERKYRIDDNVISRTQADIPYIIGKITQIQDEYVFLLEATILKMDQRTGSPLLQFGSQTRRVSSS